MFIWFAVLSAAGVALVFRDPRLDHRLVALGSILPIPLDLLVGSVTGDARRVGPFHSIVIHVAGLVAVMAGTIGRRARRKQLLAVSIGGFFHLVLDAAFTNTTAFLWPFASGNRGQQQIFNRGWFVNVLLELGGAVVALWVVNRANLRTRSARDALMSSGRLEIGVRPRRQRL